jgi:hypothetical protein
MAGAAVGVGRCRTSRAAHDFEACLDENAIAAVKVELDGQAYAMEGLT